MFQVINNNKNSSECIGTSIVKSNDTMLSSLPTPADYIAVPEVSGAEAATTVVLQVFLNPDDLPVGTTLNDYREKPIASVCENGETPQVAFDGKGMKLTNYGTYTIESPSNINNFRLVPFVADLNVYCVFNFYK